MTMEEYERLCPYQDDLHENWGPPPGHLNSDGQNLLVFGAKFGNVFIGALAASCDAAVPSRRRRDSPPGEKAMGGFFSDFERVSGEIATRHISHTGVQPSFGYEGDPMRLLFSKSASPHHGFAAYYTYLESVFGADAVLHFGTHGSLEFMPGKQVGMSGECYPDRLAGTIPNLYYYAANNPSEATIAKRRSYAATISYLTPPAENAGLYKGLKELSELVSSYQGLRENEARGPSIVNSIIAAAYSCNLDKDVRNLPDVEFDSKEVDLERRDTIVGMVYQRLMEIESRLLPMGLHTVGVPPTAEEAIATLVSIAEIDRPEDEILGLPRILANAEGRKLEEIYRNANEGVLQDVELLQKITQGTRAAVRALVDESTDSQGRVKEVQNVMEKALGGMFGQAPYRTALASAGFPKASEDKMLEPLFEYLEFCMISAF